MGVLPGVTKADTVHSLNLSTALRYLDIEIRRGSDGAERVYMALFVRMTSSMTSRLALAIICTTARSVPLPICFWPEAAVVWGTLAAPERAVRVPAKAEVLQVGRFEERGRGAFAADLVE